MNPGLLQFDPPKRCNPDEAPPGYQAVNKSSIGEDRGNYCNHCDFRAKCCDPATDLLAYGHRCSSAPVRALRDGKVYQREDGASVVFKLRVVETAPPEESTCG